MRGHLVIAFVAGGLAPINPCGFSLLPAFLSLHLADAATRDSRAGARVAAGVAMGGAVAAGFVGVFVAAGLPLALGASFLTRYVPWVGIAIGGGLVIAGTSILLGKRLSLETHLSGRRGPRGPVAFGVGYGAASIGCTLPVFLAVVGAGAASAAAIGVLASFAAYGAGTAAMLIVLGVGAAHAEGSIAARMKRLVPHMQRVSGVLLVAAGIYLSYYWIRLATLGATTAHADPVTRMVATAVAATERVAAAHGHLIMALVLVAATAAIVVAARARDDAKDPRSARPEGS